MTTKWAVVYALAFWNSCHSAAAEVAALRRAGSALVASLRSARGSKRTALYVWTAPLRDRQLETETQVRGRQIWWGDVR